jgi:hypothetical protein
MRNFEDCESLVVELKAFMFKSLYVWVASHNSLLLSNFLKFLGMCSSP